MWAPLLGQPGLLVLHSYVELGTGLSMRLNARLQEALTDAVAAMTGPLTELTAVVNHVCMLEATHAALARLMAMDSWHALVHSAGLVRRLVSWVRHGMCCAIACMWSWYCRVCVHAHSENGTYL